MPGTKAPWMDDILVLLGAVMPQTGGRQYSVTLTAIDSDLHQHQVLFFS